MNTLDITRRFESDALHDIISKILLRYEVVVYLLSVSQQYFSVID